MESSDRKSVEGFIQSLARGLGVLTAFQPGREKLTMTQVASACDLSRAGARRILLTLQTLGYVAVDGRHFYLMPRVLELGQGYLRQSFWEEIRPTLQSIADELNETTSAGVLDGFDIVYTIRARSSRMLHLELRTGAHLPAHATALGRSLLAGLPEAELTEYLQKADLVRYTEATVTDQDELRRILDQVRMQGWCYVCGEMDEGISAISAPLIDPRGETIAALNISTSPARSSKRKVEEVIVPMLQDAVASLRKKLWPRSPRSQQELWPHPPPKN